MRTNPINALVLNLQVLPVNKYNMWTQDDISTFSQIVATDSTQQFNCVNVYPSDDPDFPHLVELFLYLPVPTVRVGQLCIQKALSTVNVSNLMINQGQ